MILTDNVLNLKRSFPDAWNKLEKIRSADDIQMIETKSGYPTITVQAEGRTNYIHSKYDPLEEAKRFIDQFDNVAEYQHVFFYGVGLGYHIKAFTEKYPNIPFTMYEPNPQIMHMYLTQSSLNSIQIRNLKNIYIETKPEEIAGLLSGFVEKIKDNVLLVTLPSYERIFKEDFKRFKDYFSQIIKERIQGMRVNAGFEKRWTINSMFNMKETLNSPNISYQGKKHLQGKPALLIAAGPSLNDEIENLRHIKENGLAYIFAVGSAINTLLANEIYPDAACTYDPGEFNQNVFVSMQERGIKDIPLIFGSSVGFETLMNYPGPKLHMLTSQDTVSPYYLQKQDNAHTIVNDAPSIAAITLQLLSIIGCSEVILVGQNLAYRGKEQYSKGIKYYDSRMFINKEQLEKAPMVEDVYGNQIYTSNGFLSMKSQIELYIENYQKTKVINTTKGGASIKGAPFIELEQLMKTTLNKKVVAHPWYEDEFVNYDHDFMIERTKKMEDEWEQFGMMTKQMIRLFNDMNNLLKVNDQKRIEKVFSKFDKTFKGMEKNHFFNFILKPMNRVQFDFLINEIKAIRFEKNIKVKVDHIIHHFGKYIYGLTKDVEQFRPVIHYMHQSIREFVNQQELVSNSDKDEIAQ